MSRQTALGALGEIHRCLRPGGLICAIDLDGYLYNIHPRSALVDKVIRRLMEMDQFDFHIGRKIPEMLQMVGLTEIKWKVEPIAFQGAELKEEITLIRERFDQSLPFLASLLGSEVQARNFIEEYINCLHSTDTVLFYNKFIVQAEK